jgi:hypothetical protein
MRMHEKRGVDDDNSTKESDIGEEKRKGYGQ